MPSKRLGTLQVVEVSSNGFSVYVFMGVVVVGPLRMGVGECFAIGCDILRLELMVASAASTSTLT